MRPDVCCIAMPNHATTRLPGPTLHCYSVSKIAGCAEQIASPRWRTTPSGLDRRGFDVKLEELSRMRTVWCHHQSVRFCVSYAVSSAQSGKSHMGANGKCCVLRMRRHMALNVQRHRCCNACLSIVLEDDDEQLTTASYLESPPNLKVHCGNVCFRRSKTITSPELVLNVHAREL